MDGCGELIEGAATDTPYTLNLVQNSGVVGTFEVENVELLPSSGRSDTTFHVTFQSAVALSMTPGSTSLFFYGGPGGGSAVTSAITSFTQTFVDGVYRIEADVASMTTTRWFEFACFATGTRIATPDGSIEVQDLQPGDVVATLAGPAVVTWIGHRRIQHTDVVRVRAGTLGAARDLIVSDDHALYLDDVLVPAGLLVNGENIRRERHDDVTLWHVELERHAILLAEGVAAESYLDTGNRRQFANCPIAYDPIQATQDPYAEMVLAGERLERVRELLRLPART